MTDQQTLETACPECGHIIHMEHQPEEPDVGLPEGWHGYCPRCEVTWLLTDGEMREARHGR